MQELHFEEAADPRGGHHNIRLLRLRPGLPQFLSAAALLPDQQRERALLPPGGGGPAAAWCESYLQRWNGPGNTTTQVGTS